MNRRHFLEHTLAGAVLPAFLNNLPLSAFGAVAPEAESDKVLVIIQLAGGNDGLNTVIPVDKYTQYKSARGTIAIPENKILKFSGVDSAGLHPSMTGLQSLYNQGKVRVIQGVNYPQSNFSHFRATDIWNTASDANQVVSTGWAGRYLSLQNPNYPDGYPNANRPDPLAIQIGSILSPAFMGPVTGMGLAISSVAAFNTLVTGKDDVVPNTPAGKELTFLRKIAAQTNKYGTVIKTAAAKVTKQGTYPSTNLANQLKIVAQLIGGGLKTKVYLVSIGGFDTHANQAVATDPTTGAHANLLAQLSDAIKAFLDDLKGLGVSKKVIGMTFSEFGRRIKANASGGTDHGTAAPMFLFGDSVNPGIMGKTPNLPAAAQVSDNIDMQFDFRMIYQSILENWFCEDTKTADQVMLKNFQAQALLDPTACGKVTAIELTIKNEVFVNYPNPFNDYTTFSFESKGEQISIEIIDLKGETVAVPVNGFYPHGRHETMFNGSHLQSGTYFARFQSQDTQQVRKMIKI